MSLKPGDKPGYPDFLKGMLDKGAGRNIDTLSYHSQHAFKYLGRLQDTSDDETGYVRLIRNTLKASGIKSDFPIWDSERGVAWQSPDSERIDQDSGQRRILNEYDSRNYLEVAQRMPEIHVAAFASDVRKIFWFDMDSSTATIGKVNQRYGFFDAELQPMPHLAVYDAMTEIIGDAVFIKMEENKNGSRVYLFKSGDNTLAVMFNWKSLHEEITLNSTGDITYLDIMGNQVDNKSHTSSIGAWTTYAIIENVEPKSVVIVFSQRESAQ